MTKKIISLLLVFTVVLGCGTICSFAADSLRFGTDYTYSRVVFTNSTPEEITELETGNITATITIKGSVAPQFFAVILYEGEKMIDAAVDSTPTGAISTGLTFDATINVTNASTQKLVTVLWDGAKTMEAVCPAALSTGTKALKAIYVDGEKVNLPSGFYTATVDIKDPLSSVHPKIAYEVYDNATSVEIIEGTAFPATSGATVSTTIKVKPFKGTLKTYTINHRYDATPKKINPNTEFLYLDTNAILRLPNWASFSYQQGAGSSSVKDTVSNIASTAVDYTDTPVKVTVTSNAKLSQNAFIVVRPANNDKGSHNKVIVNADGTSLTARDNADSWKGKDAEGNKLYEQISDTKPVVFTNGTDTVDLPVIYNLTSAAANIGDTGVSIYNRMPRTGAFHLMKANSTIIGAEFIPLNIEGQGANGGTITFYVGQDAIIDVYGKTGGTTPSSTLANSNITVTVNDASVEAIAKPTETGIAGYKNPVDRDLLSGADKWYFDLTLAYFDYLGYVNGIDYIYNATDGTLLSFAGIGEGKMGGTNLMSEIEKTGAFQLVALSSTVPAGDIAYIADQSGTANRRVAGLIDPDTDLRLTGLGLSTGNGDAIHQANKEKILTLFDATYVCPTEAQVSPSTKTWTLNDYTSFSTEIPVPAATGGTTQASTVDYVVEENTVTGNIDITVSGKVKNTAKGDDVRIELLQIGKNANATPDANTIQNSYTSATNLKADFAAIKQVSAGTGGTINEVISVPASNTGIYQLIINGEHTKNCSVITEAGVRAIFEAIKLNCPSATTTAVNYLKTNFNLTNTEENIWLAAFSITEPLVTNAQIDQDKMFALFISLIPEIRTDSNYKTDLKEKLEFAATATALDQGVIDIKDYVTYFGISSAYQTAYGELSTTEQAAFSNEYFTGKGYTTKADVQSAYKNAVLLTKINNIDYWSKAENFIDDYGSYVGINMSTYNSAAFADTSLRTELYNYVVDLGTYTSLATFADDVNNKMNLIIEENGAGSGSGFGGGGGGGSTSSSAGAGTTGGTLIPGTGPITSQGTIPTTPGPAGAFNDLANHDWAKASIEACFKRGIVNGTGNGNFEPERNVAREEILVMLLRAYGVKTGTETASFNDAEAGSWYNASLATAKALGFISGKPDGSFGIGEAVTREDVAVMAYNIAKANGITFDTIEKAAFADASDISDYAKEAVTALKNLSVINGKGDGIFAPKANCTRAEAAKIIYTLISK